MNARNFSRLVTAALSAIGVCAAPAAADSVSYRLPPKAIEDVLRAPAIPSVVLSPTKETFAIVTPLRYPPIADLARPMLRLAGLRIDPSTNGRHHAAAYTSVAIERVHDGAVMPVALPPNARVTSMRFSPDGKHFAFANATEHGTDLYIGRTADASIKRVPGIKLNGVFEDPIAWMPGGKQLVVLAVARTGPPPPAPAAPTGPVVQQTTGTSGAVTTFEDLLSDSHDETLFDYYGSSAPTLVDIAKLSTKRVGARAIYAHVAPSPGGAYLLTERLHRPYSYLFPYDRFPTLTSVIDLRNAKETTVVDGPLHDALPYDGVPTGPRNVKWQPNVPATVVWWEALDGGDPKTPATYRDRLMQRALPFHDAAVELARPAARAEDVMWLQDDPRALVTEYDRDARLTTTSVLDTRAPHALHVFGKPLRDGDHYNDPGTPLYVTAPTGETVILHDGDDIYLRGAGYGPEGRRPFLDRVSLADGSATRLFRSDLAPLDSVIGVGDAKATSIFIVRQSPTLPPNLIVRAAGVDRPLTAFVDPTPQVRTIERRVVTYERPDGVHLSFTLYLPPGYKEGTRLPTFLWAYPLEYNDASVASQNVNDTQSFTQVGGASEIFMALAGYAVLDNASIPIVGDPQTVNDTYVEQLVAGAKAAIDKAAEIGVTDPDRVAVGGHSYGAFMTMNLLAHSKLFRAGIARSGAYNRTLTPFGFQSERRSYWEATDLYTKMSPFTYANAITTPVLMIHGMKDDNTGTFPIQSERMYAALKGNGATARLVMLPDEAHGYLARETIETVLAEMVGWLDTYVRDAPQHEVSR
jgi:dipeptidyl aminopeptidase/acylaminoacyl peptidase